ncbi:MAG: hypothetical protein HZR80_14060 [Candidatus Heimdallarchaeota archaeon]
MKVKLCLLNLAPVQLFYSLLTPYLLGISRILPKKIMFVFFNGRYLVFYWYRKGNVQFFTASFNKWSNFSWLLVLITLGTLIAIGLIFYAGILQHKLDNSSYERHLNNRYVEKYHVFSFIGGVLGSIVTLTFIPFASWVKEEGNLLTSVGFSTYFWKLRFFGFYISLGFFIFVAIWSLNNFSYYQPKPIYGTESSRRLSDLANVRSPNFILHNLDDTPFPIPSRLLYLFFEKGSDFKERFLPPGHQFVFVNSEIILYMDKNHTNHLLNKGITSRFTCFYCGEALSLEDKICLYCFQSPLHCSVCKLPINKDELISQCPKCGVYSHKDHLDAWIRTQNKCPSCLQEFSVSCNNLT